MFQRVPLPFYSHNSYSNNIGTDVERTEESLRQDACSNNKEVIFAYCFTRDLHVFALRCRGLYGGNTLRYFKRIPHLCVLPKKTTQMPVERTSFTSSINAPFQQEWLSPLQLAVAILNGGNYVISVYFIAFLMHNYALITTQVGPFLSIMAWDN